MEKEEVELRKEFMEKGAKLVSKLMVGGVFFYFFFLVSFIHNHVPIAAVQQSDPVIHIYTFLCL